MKKKYFSFIFAFVLLVPCMLLLTACGGKKVTAITIDNMFVGERKDVYVYEYGTSINDIISTDLTVTAQYDDNSTKVLNSDEYKIEFFKDSQKVEKIKDLPDVGYYSIRVSYDIFMQESFFEIIPSEYYTVSLSHKSWDYGDEDNIPTVTLANYDLQEGDNVSYYYIEKSVFDNLDEQEKKYPSYYANDWASVADGTTTLDAGQYYVFADITFVNPSNYTGLTVIDNNSLITVNKKRIVVTPEDAVGVSAMTFDYGNSYNTSSDGKYIIGDIALKLITLNNNYVTISDIAGRFEWKNPDQTLNSSNSGQTAYPIVFIPDYSNNYEAVYSEGELTLPVAIEKGVVGDPEEMKIYFENTNEETTTLYDGQEHSVLLNNHFDIHNYGGELKNIVTFKNQNGEDVAVRYEELDGGLDALFIDGLKEIGTYQFIVSIVDTTNYCWGNGTTDPIKFSVTIVGNSDLLDVEDDYQPVTPKTDGNQNPQPDYMEYMGRWMEIGKETTAPDYDAQIQIDYKDQNQTLNITGILNNKYNDVETYNSFTTNTTLTDGKDNYVINGQVNTADLSNGYTVTKNGEATNFVINEDLHDLIMTALGIDLANNSMSSEEQIWSVAQDSENLKIKIEINFEGGVTVVHFVFDAEGNFVGHKVSMTSVDGTMSYSIQMKLVK